MRCSSLPAMIGSAVLLSAINLIALFLAWEHCPSDARAADPPCEAPSEWFGPGGTPKVPDTFTIASDDDECSFYKWAWQSFLWLNQSDTQDGLPRFVMFKTINDLFPTPSQLIATAPPMDTGKRILSLVVRTSPLTSRAVTTIATSQAGSHGVVVDKNGRAVYYGIHYNDKFETFLKNTLNLKKPDDIAAIAPTAAFPEGCLELKSAWRVLSDDEKLHVDDVRKRFFVTDAKVPTLVQLTDASGRISIHADPNPPRDEKVALIGLHVVGTIIGHPEFIWASFEHKENAPTLKNQNLPSSSPISDNDFTFYRKGKKLLECNINAVASTSSPLRLIDPAKQTLTPITDLFRQYNSGDDFETVDDKVDSLNTSVAGKLTDKLSVWKNYQLMGAIWMKNTSTNFAEGLVFGDNVLVGEKRLSNTLMESYTQFTQRNCFACHNTASETENGRTIPDLRVKISHIVKNAYIYGR
jgi:hypothetical protein